jgi:hypothetical protein
MGTETLEPIRILEVIVDKVTTPRNDGTPGGGLYKVPLRLSRAASPLWAKEFAKTWDSPPSYTARHRRGIARVSGDVLTLDGTTIEEIAEVHKTTLKIVIEHTNRAVVAIEESEQRKAKADLEHQQALEKKIKDAAKTLKFV